MSLNRVVSENFDRMDTDKFGKQIPVYRRKITYRSKNEVQEYLAEQAKRFEELLKKYNDRKKQREGKSEVEILPVENNNVNPMAQ